MRHMFIWIAALLLLAPLAAHGDLLINEYLARNETGLLDEDGDREDWIELYNSGDTELPLAGYWLSDDEDLPRKWELPDLPLAAGAFLLIHASGKADAAHILHTNFKISADGEILLLGAPGGQVLSRIATGLMPADLDPIPITESTVIRARTFAPGMLPSVEMKFSFLIGEMGPLPRVSLITDPPGFFDADIGIYVFGDSYNPNYPFYGANFWQDWERPVHIQLFEPDGAEGFAVDAGVKIHGRWSRANAQKSLRVIMRDRFGAARIEYPIFPDELVSSFAILLLRNAGNDWSRA